MDDAGANVRRLSGGGGDAVQPSWDPQGQNVAFAWTRGFEPGNYNIFIIKRGHRRVGPTGRMARAGMSILLGRPAARTSRLRRTGPEARRFGPCVLTGGSFGSSRRREKTNSPFGE